MTELPAMADRPRYSTRTFPPYRFIPGQALHPRRHPQGHSFSLPEPHPPRFIPDKWHTSDDYRYAIDLYNFAYWWESHEIFEGFWHAFGPKTGEGRFFQALIQIAAANLKQFVGHDKAASNLIQRGIERLKTYPPYYIGVDLAELIEYLGLWAQDRSTGYVHITLERRDRSPTTEA